MKSHLKNTLITEESIKRLNEENHAREELNSELNKAIEKQVNIYLSSVSKREDREQLSKPQLVSSHKKTWEWLSKVKQNAEPAIIPDEVLKQDIDPVLYDPNLSQPDINPTATPTSMLTGEDFVSNLLPFCLVEEVDMEVKQMRMRDWLVERQAKISERDKMKAWMTENGFDEVSENASRYQALHPHHTTNQWIEIYSLKSNHLLSTNDLLRLYRNEVPAATRHEMKSPQNNNNNHKQQMRWDRFNATHTSNASNASCNSNFNNEVSPPNNNNPNRINNTNYHSNNNNLK